jgi:hypothetical protein
LGAHPNRRHDADLLPACEMTDLYQITLPDGRAYIGVSKNLPRRIQHHSRTASQIGEAIRQVGLENVSFRTLVRGSRDYIYALESKAIQAFNTRWPHGLNISTGGFGCRDPLPETRTKIGLANSGTKHPHLAELNRKRRGEKLSPLRVAKTAAAHRGMKRSAETCARLSAKAKLRRPGPCSDERRANISAGRRAGIEARRCL